MGLCKICLSNECSEYGLPVPDRAQCKDCTISTRLYKAIFVLVQADKAPNVTFTCNLIISKGFGLCFSKTNMTATQLKLLKDQSN